MTKDQKEIRYEGIHCNHLEQPSNRVIVIRISGTDVGEFQGAPMRALSEWVADSQAVELFSDARDVHGAAVAVSGGSRIWKD